RSSSRRWWRWPGRPAGSDPATSTTNGSRPPTGLTSALHRTILPRPGAGMIGLLTWLALTPVSAAADWYPGDYLGADIHLSSLDYVHPGVYANVGTFRVPPGAIVFQEGT